MDSEPGTSKETNEQQQQCEILYRGEKNCCVPQCGNNSRKNPLLSFHKIPKDESLRKKWTKLLKTKGLCNPTNNHLVCSAHFPGGKKTYDNNMPTIFDTTKPLKQRRLIVKRELCNLSEANETSSTDIVTTEDTTKEEPVEQLSICTIREQLEALKEEYKQLEAKYDRDTKEMKNCLFRLERFISSDIDFKFYTGFPDYTTFKAFFNYLSPECCHLNYHGSTTAPILSDTQKKCGKQRSLSPEEELFMVLSRLRCGFLGQDLAHRYGISPSHLSRIWTTWITFLHQRLRAMPIWPSREFVDSNMPACFKEEFPNTRVIIDCTEFYIEKPSSFRSQSVTFSSYKNHNTAKGLLGISPSGYPSYVSSLYVGRVSDKKITCDCGILNLLGPGDQVMADRGFDIQGDLPTGVTLNIPPFLNGNDELTLEETVSTRKIASARIHVERAIARIKNYRLLHQVIPLSMASDLDKIWGVCSYLTLFLPPLIINEC